MTEEVATDLKQFMTRKFDAIENRLSNVESHVASLDRKVAALDGKVTVLDRKFDELSMSVAQAIDAANDVTAAQLEGHAVRLAYLEHKAA